jgi:hypothetical protein
MSMHVRLPVVVLLVAGIVLSPAGGRSSHQPAAMAAPSAPSTETCSTPLAWNSNSPVDCSRVAGEATSSHLTDPAIAPTHLPTTTTGTAALPPTGTGANVSYFALIAMHSPAPPAAIWSIQKVDAADGAAAQPALALDSTAHPYLTYYFCYVSQPRDCELKIAHWTGAIWSIGLVDANPGLSGPSVGGPSIAVDTSDRPHISYYRHGASGNYVVYARWTGAAWDSQQVDGADFVGPATSLTLDGMNTPHIAYYDYARDEIRYGL